MVQLERNQLIGTILVDWLNFAEPILRLEKKMEKNPSLIIKLIGDAFYDALDFEGSSWTVETLRLHGPEKGFQLLNPNLFLENAYYKSVHPESTTHKDWQLTYYTYKPLQPFVAGDLIIDPDRYFHELTPIGFFEKPFTYLVIEQHQGVWMSVTPFEIITMQPVLETLSGHVLTFGLGLGYFAFMALNNPLVNHVTVIEKDESVIHLFQQQILPFFPHPERLTIIHQDAFEFVKNPFHADHLFIDIYRTVDDAWSLYVCLKQDELRWGGTVWSFWLETSILAYLRRAHLLLFSRKKPSFDHPKRKLTSREHQARLIIHHVHLTFVKALQEGQNLDDLLSDGSLKKAYKNPIV